MSTELHAPMLPFLRHVLAQAPIAHTGLILDVACGNCEKWSLYQEILGPNIRLVGIDIIMPYIRIDVACHVRTPICHVPTIQADAHALPFANAVFDGAICVAALGLFAEPQRALSEMQHVLRPGAVALVLTAEQRWVQLWQWQPVLTQRIAEACAELALPLAHADVGGDLREQLQHAGFGAVTSMAGLLDSPYPPIVAALALLPWPDLQPILAAYLTAAEMAACQQAPYEIELCSIVLAAWGMVS
jgi:ubiquinone/menaquinone biosynthesis C-methylase UbiE